MLSYFVVAQPIRMPTDELLFDIEDNTVSAFAYNDIRINESQVCFPNDSQIVFENGKYLLYNNGEYVAVLNQEELPGFSGNLNTFLGGE
jgi:hypothetical protein